MRDLWRDDELPRSRGVARGRRPSLVLVVGATIAWSCGPSTPDSAPPTFDVMENDDRGVGSGVGLGRGDVS